MRHVIYCPHCRLGVCQPSDVISVLTGLLNRCLASLICIVHPNSCTLYNRLCSYSQLYNQLDELSKLANGPSQAAVVI